MPASQPRFHAKADQSIADQVFLDLEDSVAPEVKVQARNQAVDAFRAYAFVGKVKSARINACDTKWCFEDVIALLDGAGDRLDSLIVPKVEEVDHVHFVDNLLTQLELKHGFDRRIGLELQIESARGMENVNAIASASLRTETLIFGPADFSASLGVPELSVGSLKAEYPGDYWHYFLARIAVASRANGLQPVDGPYAHIRDLDGLRALATRAAMLGFDGKWALHPSQLEVLNEVFTPSKQDFDRAMAILEAYSQATDIRNTGAIMLDGEMIDEASRKMARVMVERGRMYGL